MIYALILAGGRGERLWPYSRISRPKHLLPLLGDMTMIQQTVARLKGLVSDENIFVITEGGQKAAIEQQLPQIKPAQIVPEPFGRNTAAAVALGAVYIERKDPDGVMIVLSSDHFIDKTEIFQRTLRDCAKMAREEDSLVIMGVKPTYPNTGYGYIKIGDELGSDADTKFWRVGSFKEKPDFETAKEYFEGGDYFWNTGMFIWKTAAIMNEFERHMPKLYGGCLQIREAIGAEREQKTIEEVYTSLDRVPIDIGIMEKAGNVVMGRADFDWDDIGSWLSMENHISADSNHNMSNCDFEQIDSKNLIAINEDGFVGAIGVEDIIVVKSGDAVLVCHRDRAQDVKKLVEKMAKNTKCARYLE